MNRKQFLQLTGGAIGAAAIPQSLQAFDATAKGKLSIQLYTIRDAIKADLEGSLNKLASLGFKYVETAFWPENITLKRAADAIKAAGLKVSSCHVELPFDTNQKVFVETAAAFECNRLIWHGWPEDKRYSSLAGTRELISMYNKSAVFAKGLGLEFGLHNHWWEFRNKVEGKPVFEYLLKETDPSIFFEIDTYWVKVAGYTPSDIITKFGKRARYLHVKDGPAEWNEKLVSDNPDPMTAVGKGTQNIPGIINAAKHADYFVVEMDKVEGDVFEKIKESVEYLKKLGVR